MTATTSRDGALWRPTSSASFGLVALAAAMWGTDPLLRQGLALNLPTTLIVWVEHALPTLLVIPLVVRGLRRAARSFTALDWVFLVVLGCGASALATLLFTTAFTFGSPTTPALLQQVQPLVAVAGAHLLLGEHVRRRFVAYLVLGLLGAYLIAFANPLSVDVQGLAPALLALAAAALWGLGTVLGRRLGAKMPFKELTALRLFFGLLAVSVVLPLNGDLGAFGRVDLKAAIALVLLALVPGLLSLLVYYRGLQGTPASAATIAELAFPLTTVLVSYLVFHVVLSPTQWLGVVVLAGTMTVMGLVRARNAAPLGVDAPPPAELPVGAMTD
ncbi:DMT family transporter [Amnibacterium sp. CER49]|uniref:DMT family transporter n=1 Tax=Amnibacterium sp. CER49 TaxID=3039161 RepID=UPI002448342A|nr:DMT family transporter [Amnibacterium sp. CER49]MDH2442478.1 DMT family transporter [Amnibacterium sp. CER49]